MTRPWLIVAADVAPIGGMDRANHALARYLSRAGYSLHLVTHRIAEDLGSIPQVVFHRVPKPLGSYAFGAPLLARMGRKVGRSIAEAGGRVLTNGGNCRFPDISWVHYVHAEFRPHSATSRCRWLKQQIEHRLYLQMEKKALRIARMVICNSIATRQAVVERLGIPQERTRVVYYGSDPVAFHPAASERRDYLRRQFGWPTDQPVAIFVGALGDQRKGFDTLFDAWIQLCAQSDWEAVLAVVGRGAALPKWQARTESAGLTERIRFLGFRTDVSELLQAADLLVSPTRYEAYGLGVQEALCCGLPAIVSAAAGVAEHYPTECGDLLLPNADDASDLARRIETTIRNRSHLQSHVNALGAKLRSWSWDDMAAEMMRLIEGTD